MKKFKMVINISLIVLLSIVFIFSIYKISGLLMSSYENNKLYNEIMDNVKIEETIVDGETMKIIDFTNLFRMNIDTRAWMTFNEINYPIVQALDNNYYAKKAFNKKESIQGSIFLDYRNNGFNDYNSIIYGHNAKKMFGSLKQVLNNSYFDDGGNDIINITTPNNNYNYQIFSVYVIPKEDYYITTLFTTESFKSFVETIIKRSYYKFNIPVNEGDKILTLSTCHGYNNTSNRLVIHAKLI